MKLAFAGTPDFAAPILAAIAASRHTVCLVVTQPDRPAGRGGRLTAPPVKETALRLQLPVVQPESINRREALAALVAAAPDALIVVAYGKILTRRALGLPRLGCFNIHASLLPKYRGASPIAAAILHGERETGITIQRMAPGIDTGPVLMRRVTPIGPAENAGELAERLSALAAEMVVPFLDALDAGTLTEEPQGHSHTPVAAKLEKGEGLIPWARSAREVCDFIRAMTPWPGAFTFHRTAAGHVRGRVTILAARPAEGAGPHAGQVLRADKILVVAAGQGVVEVLQLKPDGGKPMDAAAYMRGRAVQVGDRLH